MQLSLLVNINPSHNWRPEYNKDFGLDHSKHPKHRSIAVASLVLTLILMTNLYLTVEQHQQMHFILQKKKRKKS